MNKKGKTKSIIINQNLINKYGNSNEECNKQFIYSLLNNKKCHYTSIFKDYLIYDYIDEFLKKGYSIQESKLKLPKISIYYFHYLSFFCRPFFRNFYYNNIIQNYFDNKAEIFYKETYEIKNNSFKKRKKEEKEFIIFDQKTRKLLESTIIQNTIDLNLNEINTIKNNNKDEEFFTIKTQNDILLEILNNLSTHQNENKSKKKEDDKSKKNTRNNSKKNSSEKKSNLQINFIRNSKNGLFNLYKKCKVTSERDRILSSGNSNSPNFQSNSNLINFKKCRPQYNMHKNSFILNSNMTSYIKNNNKNQSLKVSYSKGNFNQSKINLEKKNFKKIQTKSFSHYNRNNIEHKNSNLILNYLNCIHSNNSRSRSIKYRGKKNMKDSLEMKSTSNIFSVRSYQQIGNGNKSVINSYLNNICKKEKSKSKNKKIKVNKSLDYLIKNVDCINEINNNHKENNFINFPEKKSVNLNLNLNLNDVNINSVNASSNISFKIKNNSIKKKNNKSNERNKIINKEMEKLIKKIKDLNPNRINEIIFSNKNKLNNDILSHFEHLVSSGFNTTNQRNKKEIIYKHITKKNICKKQINKKHARKVFSSREGSSNKCKSVFNSSK